MTLEDNVYRFTLFDEFFTRLVFVIPRWSVYCVVLMATRGKFIDTIYFYFSTAVHWISVTEINGRGLFWENARFHDIISNSRLETISLRTRKFERLVGPLSVHKYKVIMSCPNMMSWRHLIRETGCQDLSCFISNSTPSVRNCCSTTSWISCLGKNVLFPLHWNQLRTMKTLKEF